MSPLCNIPDVQDNPRLRCALHEMEQAIENERKLRLSVVCTESLSAYITYLKQGVRSGKQTIEQILARPTPPRDTYDLAEMITAKVQAGTWTAQAVADAIQKYIEARPC